MDGKFFLLGVGAQKGGTTWLHRYLSGDPSVRLHTVKEWHIWDTLTVPEFARFRASLKRQGFLRNLAFRLSGRNKGGLRRRFLADPESYFDFFADELKADGIRLTADITPSYSALSNETLRRIRDGFAARGVPVRAVLLMRDPVGRCWSHYRMMRAIGSTEGMGPTGDGFEAYFPTFCAGPEAQLRTDYAATARRLRAAFAPEELFFGFFETLFQPAEIERLSAFLGIAARPDMGAVKVHSGKDGSSLDPAIRAEARRVLDPIYRSTAELFPESAALWARP